jgi:hypothetical protein
LVWLVFVFVLGLFVWLVFGFVVVLVWLVLWGLGLFVGLVFVDTLDIGTHNAFEIGPSVREHLLNRYQGQPVLIRDFILTWLGQKTGTSDLLFTLRVLFGS